MQSPVTHALALRGLLTTASGALALHVSAQDATPAVTPPVVMTTGLLQITLNLLLVLAAIVILAWLFKRVQGVGQPAAGQLNVSATLPLGPKDRILLVDIGDEQIVVGASAAGLTTLHVMRTPLGPQTPAPPAAFKDKLAAALRRTNV